MIRPIQSLTRATSEPIPHRLASQSGPAFAMVRSVSSSTWEDDYQTAFARGEALPYRATPQACRIHDSPWSPCQCAPSSQQRHEASQSPPLSYRSSVDSPASRLQQITSHRECYIRPCRIQQQIDIDLAGIGAGICQVDGSRPPNHMYNANVAKIDQDLQQVMMELATANSKISRVLSLLEDIQSKSQP